MQSSHSIVSSLADCMGVAVLVDPLVCGKRRERERRITFGLDTFVRLERGPLKEKPCFVWIMGTRSG